MPHIAARQYNIFRFLRRFVFAYCYKSFFCPSSLRIRLLRLCGVHIGRDCFVGQFVLFDDLYPQNIFIGDGTSITAGTKILTHFKDTDTGRFEVGEIHIGSHCFIGMNTLFTKPVHIGDYTVVGGGAVVTKDLPERTVCAGVPCRVIKKLERGALL